jgi:hypothetical protein
VGLIRPANDSGVDLMKSIRENYIKREAQYKAAQYVAEKQYERQQIAEARRDFLIIAVGGLLFASIIGGLLNA